MFPKKGRLPTLCGPPNWQTYPLLCNFGLNDQWKCIFSHLLAKLANPSAVGGLSYLLLVHRASCVPVDSRCTLFCFLSRRMRLTFWFAVQAAFALGLRCKLFSFWFTVQTIGLLAHCVGYLCLIHGESYLLLVHGASNSLRVHGAWQSVSQSVVSDAMWHGFLPRLSSNPACVVASGRWKNTWDPLGVVFCFVFSGVRGWRNKEALFDVVNLAWNSSSVIRDTLWQPANGLAHSTK